MTCNLVTKALIKGKLQETFFYCTVLSVRGTYNEFWVSYLYNNKTAFAEFSLRWFNSHH